MDVLILGNGFDLQHHLPTKYVNFLNVVNFLNLSYDSEKMHTVGDIFSCAKLQEKDEWIAECYSKHKRIYDETPLKDDEIKELIGKSKENCWFNYFSKNFDKDSGWIDFEKEIAKVIEAHRDWFKVIRPMFGFKHLLKDDKKSFICSNFDFYYDLTGGSFGGGNEKVKNVKKAYCIETPPHSKHIEVNKEEIISKLYSELRSFSKLLRLYLTVFVESSLFVMNLEKFLPCGSFYSEAEKVISFNYTSTFNKLYGISANADVGHIHGTVRDEIVLGINPDKYDEIKDLDTSFIQFKKYYQRVRFNADESYSEIFSDCNFDAESMDLCIIGHSLDITDSDILKEWIEKSSSIVIYYHNENVIGSYIKNLIAMFGKKEFDSIRKEKKLTFKKNPDITFTMK